MSAKVGFIGLGVMGAAMANNLSSKFPELMVFDVDKDKTLSLLTDNMIPANSLEELGLLCSIVFLSLPTTEIVEKVILGNSGLAGVMSSGDVIIDTSTTEGSAITKIVSELGSRGIEFLDAPVSGGEKAAIGGTLSFMVGGNETIFEKLAEYFHAMGTSVIRVGETSMGQTAKAVNQMIVGASFAVIAESFAMGVRLGLDPKVLYEAIRYGWAGSVVLDVAVKDMLSREFKPGGTVDIHWKDLGYSLGLAKDTDVPVPVTAIAHEVFKAARANGDGRSSQPSIVRLWESLLGVEVK